MSQNTNTYSYFANNTNSVLFSMISSAIRSTYTLLANAVYAIKSAKQHREGLAMKQKTREQLRHLTPEQLDDIGITREQADAEMNKRLGE